jgi:hypothetical protein
MPKLGLGLGLPKPIFVGGGAPVIPQDGLVLWLKPDAGLVLFGNDVLEWQDQSSAGNNFQQEEETVVAVEDNIINGYPAVLLDEGRLLGSSNIAIAKTIYAVVRTFNFQVEAYSVILECTGGGLYSAVSGPFWGSYFSEETPATTIISPNTSTIIASLSNDGETYEFRRDSQSDITEAGGDGFYTRSQSYLGNAIGLGQAANVYLSEIIVYDRVPTTPEIQQIESYLNSKYLIS